MLPMRGQLKMSIREAAGLEPAVNADDDFDGWLLEQASALRQRRHSSLSWDRLAEELEDMAALRRDALRSNLTVLLTHLLKLAYAMNPTERQRSERQWKLDVMEHRDRVKDLLHESGTLWAEFERFKIEAYNRARKRAGVLIGVNQNPVGPAQCPWSSEQILDDDFFSIPHSG
jgi:hypothetical protein